jgi:5-methylcytosine-specific restriction protein A
MPNRPRSPCSFARCPGRAIGITGRCADHPRKPQPENRPNAAQRGYGGTWQKLRLMHLARYPLCETCGEDNITEGATEVHHVIPLGDGGSNATDNLQSLCKSCHSRIKGQEKGQ